MAFPENAVSGLPPGFSHFAAGMAYCSCSLLFISFDGPEGTRTPDLYSAIVALSQLSYRPTLECMLTQPALFVKLPHSLSITLSFDLTRFLGAFGSRWWVPALLNPPTPGRNQGVVVKLQCVNRRSSHRCQTNNLNSIFTPTKMIMPNLHSWIKKRRVFSGLWINRTRFITLVPATERTA